MIDFLTIVLLIFGVLQIILFFKIWGMTNDVNNIKQKLHWKFRCSFSISRNCMIFRFFSLISAANRVKIGVRKGTASWEADPSQESKKEIIGMKSNNQINVPQAKEAMNKFKMQAASEVGVNLQNGYNGNLTSREAGSVGGQMVKKMIEAYEQSIQ